VDYQKLAEGFLQDGEKEARALFNELLRVTVHKGLLGAMPQEYLVPGHQNLKKKLRKRDLADLDRLMTRLREAQGRVAGEEAFDEVLDYLSERNAAAGLTLKDRRDALLCFPRLNVVSTLNMTFLSTNLIENVFRNWRQATDNVKVWKEGGDMAPRWVASGLL
jgi:putative transposase